MDELYTTTLGNITKIAYEETNNDGTDVDNHRKYYRVYWMNVILLADGVFVAISLSLSKN